MGSDGCRLVAPSAQNQLAPRKRDPLYTQRTGRSRARQSGPYSRALALDQVNQTYSWLSSDQSSAGIKLAPQIRIPSPRQPVARASRRSWVISTYVLKATIHVQVRMKSSVHVINVGCGTWEVGDSFLRCFIVNRRTRDRRGKKYI